MAYPLSPQDLADCAIIACIPNRDFCNIVSMLNAGTLTVTEVQMAYGFEIVGAVHRVILLGKYAYGTPEWARWTAIMLRIFDMEVSTAAEPAFFYANEPTSATAQLARLKAAVQS